MATPVLQVPINDEKFKEFLNLFNKYKSEVARLPEIWKGTNEEIIAQISSTNTIVDAIGKQTTALLEQQEIMEKNTKELDKQAKIETAREKAETKARKDAEKAQAKAVADTKKIAGNIAQATVNIVKWGAIDFLIGGALDLYGLGAISRDIGGQLSGARGVNATIGQRQALAQTFQPIFDTTNALEKAAEAQTDVTKSIPYRILGLNPNGTDPAELSIDAAIAAKKRLEGLPQQSQLLTAHALGLDQIFSDDELRRILNTPKGFLETEKSGGTLANGQKVLGYEQLKKTLDLPTDVAQEYTALGQQLSIAGREIEVHFARKLIALGPGLDKLITSVVNIGDHLIDLIDWPKLGTNLTNFAISVENAVKNIDWNLVKADIKTLATGVDNLIHKVDWDRIRVDLLEFATGVEYAMKIISKIPGVGQAMAAVAVAPVDPLLAGQMAADDLSKTVKVGNPLTAITDMAGYLGKKLGLNSIASLGVSTILWSESGLDPHNQNKQSAGLTHAQGLAQWVGPRQKEFRKVEGVDVLQATEDQQIDFINYELDHSKASVRAALAKATSVGQAMSIWSKLFEGADAAGYVSDMTRGAKALSGAKTAHHRPHVTIHTHIHGLPQNLNATQTAQVSA
jgi:hypothetical protein